MSFNISFCLNDVRHIFIFVILLPYVQLVQVFYREKKRANINKSLMLYTVKVVVMHKRVVPSVFTGTKHSYLTQRFSP